MTLPWFLNTAPGKESNVMTSFIEDPREPKTVQQIIDEVHAVKRLVEKVEAP